MREIFIALTMLSMPAAATLVLGKTAWMAMGGSGAAVAEADAAAAGATETAATAAGGAFAEGAEAFALHCAACHGGARPDASGRGERWHAVPVEGLGALDRQTREAIARYLESGRG